MISLELSPSHATTSDVAFAPLRGKESISQPVFSDSHYLRQVIRLLRTERKRKGFSMQELTSRAKLRDGVILQAEKHGVIPSCRELRVWAKSLGITWEQLWSLAFPLSDRK
jgi:ribosome-binding protein aMBF1 (putative translation factor)